MKSYQFHVSGMHCASCPILIQDALEELPEVTHARASLADASVTVQGDFGDKSVEHIARDLTAIVAPHGYTIAREPQRSRIPWEEFIPAAAIAAVFIAGFILLQKMGIVNLVTSERMTYGTAFIVGAIASISTCMAVVGGLVLSVSAKYAEGGEKVIPQVIFHVGRFISFFLFGGIIGWLGASFALGAGATAVLGMIVALVLLVLGINLLDVLPSLKRWQPSLPAVFATHIRGLRMFEHRVAPALLGAATFFLPCGFTQSMQLYTLTNGSYVQGALTMSAFALGTFPVLALLSFSSLAIHKKAQSGVFYKTAGLIVIFFGIINLVSSLTAAGIISPIINW